MSQGGSGHHELDLLEQEQDQDFGKGLTGTLRASHSLARWLE